MKLLIISDIHGNLSALEAVFADANEKYKPDAVALLGDCIDYGMRSNEVVGLISSLELPYVCRLWGNHEDAIFNGNFSRFSSARGVQSAGYTRSCLTKETIDTLMSFESKSGKAEFTLDGKKILAIHGSIDDCYWKSISPASDLTEKKAYSEYDYVLSGHSHIPHAFDIFYGCDDPIMRNKKKTTFINPGSVGQPRNHDPKAGYAILDFENGISLNRVSYDIEYEMSLYNDKIDDFYRIRLKYGI